MTEEDMGYYYNPKTDEDFIRIARDVYGAGVRDNTRQQLIKIGRDYHLKGDDTYKELNDYVDGRKP